MAKKSFQIVNGQMKKLDGWFSWRHQTNAAHLETQRQRRQREQEKLSSAIERQQYRDSLSSAEQWARLDKRLGPGAGARKERARLAS
jgi:hypothetical protein